MVNDGIHYLTIFFHPCVPLNLGPQLSTFIDKMRVTHGSLIYTHSKSHDGMKLSIQIF